MMPWRTWSNMPIDTDLPEFRDGSSSQEDVDAAIRRFNRVVLNRIAWLTDRLSLLPSEDLAEAHYVLAVLHDRLDIDVDPNILKRGVRYHAIKALRIDRYHAAACGLLGYVFDWVGLIGKALRRRPGEGPRPDHEREVVDFGRATQLMFIKRGIRYLERATQLAPDNQDYQRWLATARRELRMTESDCQDCCAGSCMDDEA